MNWDKAPFSGGVLFSGGGGLHGILLLVGGAADDDVFVDCEDAMTTPFTKTQTSKPAKCSNRATDHLERRPNTNSIADGQMTVARDES